MNETNRAPTLYCNSLAAFWRIVLLASLFLIGNLLRAQNDFQYIFRIEAIDFGISKLYDFNGATIEVFQYKVPISEEIAIDARKKNGISKKSVPLKIAEFSDFPLIFSESRMLEGDWQKVSTVFLFNQDSLATYIAFHGWRFDTLLYSQFISAYKNGMLTSGLFVSPAHADSIIFQKRNIILGPACHWMAPRSVQCEGKGQINWSIHPSLKNAEEAAQFQFFFTKHEAPMKLLSEEMVPIVFEGVPTTAKKVIWKVRGWAGFLAKEMDGSNRLVAYYVALELNGDYVHCVLSHWTNDRLNENGLPPLLSEVMALTTKLEEENNNNDK